MRPENRRALTNFLLATEPINEKEGWIEKRKAFIWEGGIYLVEDNFPYWTQSQILDFARTHKSIKVVELEVRVRPCSDDE